MAATKTFSGFGFSWADEVEKEEEEERGFRHRRRQRSRSRSRSPEKPNPFGSARPREVVLQEKGIDWRKLDSSTPREQKHLLENVPASTGGSSGGKKRWSPRSRSREPNVESARRGSGISSSSLTFPDQNVDSFVPPLRYPPKNIAILMKEKQGPDSFYKPDVSLSSFKEFHAEKQRENVIPESRMQLDSRRLDSSFQDTHLHGHSRLHDRELEWDKENPHTGNRESFAAKEKQRENVIPESGMQLDSGRLDSSFRDPHLQRNSRLHDRELEWEKENPNTQNRDNFTVKEFGHPPQGEIHREKSPLVRREKEWKKMNYHSSERHFLDERLPVENRRTHNESWDERLPVENRRTRNQSWDERLPVENRRTHNESWDDDGYEFGGTSGGRERFGRSPSVDKLPNREGLSYRPYNKEPAFSGNYRNVGARPLEELENGNMDYFGGRQRFETEYEGPRTGRMDRGRAENHRFMDVDNKSFRRNDRNSIGGNYGNVGARPLDERHAEKMDHLYGRSRFDGNDFDAPRTERNHRDMDMDKPGFRRNNRNSMGGNYGHGARPLDERRPEKMNHLHRRPSFDGKDFAASRARSMDRGRPDFHPDRETDRVGFENNYKKRGVESRPNTSHNFQRRRR